jgi:hypothetical protein
LVVDAAFGDGLLGGVDPWQSRSVVRPFFDLSRNTLKFSMLPGRDIIVLSAFTGFGPLFSALVIPVNCVMNWINNGGTSAACNFFNASGDNSAGISSNSYLHKSLLMDTILSSLDFHPNHFGDRRGAGHQPCGVGHGVGVSLSLV